MIRPPAINLARRPFRNNTAYYAVYGVCVALLLSGTGYNGWKFFTQGSELARLREDAGFGTERYMKLHNDVETMKKEIAGLDLTIINAKSGFAQGLILSKFFSWSLLFDRLEELIPLDVKVQRIAPAISTKRIEVSITGNARSPEAFLQFEANLADSAYFSNVYPVREDQQEGQTDLKFSLVMDYIPKGKERPTPPVTAEASAKEGGEAATKTPADGAPEPSAGQPAGAEPAPDVPAAVQNPTIAAVQPPPTATPSPAPAPAMATGMPLAAEPAKTQPAAASSPPIDIDNRVWMTPEQRQRRKTTPQSQVETMTDQEFLNAFGYEELKRERLLARWQKAKAKGKGKAAPVAPQGAADPNGATP